MMTTTPLPDPAELAFAEFFREHVPHPWPACPVPVTTKADPLPDHSRGSRFALAASVALLLGLGFAFTGGLGSAPPPKTGHHLSGGATADGKSLLKHADPIPDLPKMP